jgi:hypothetical protein
MSWRIAVTSVTSLRARPTVMAAVAAADGFPSLCYASSFSAQSASAATLAECGLERFPLTAVDPLPEGGELYVYDLPNGQTMSVPVTPSGFNALTASTSTDAAYGVPPMPPLLSPQYQAWAQLASRWQLSTPGQRYAYVSTYHASDPPGPYWAGYIDSGSFTTASVSFGEPSIGNTSCSGSAAVFWSGIGGVNNSDLGQDGTEIGVSGIPNHTAWIDVLPGGLIPIATGTNTYYTATPGQQVEATTYYLGNSQWEFVVAIGSTFQVRYPSGAYFGGTAEEIVERPSNGSGNVPLENLQSITMTGSNNSNAINAFPYSEVQMANQTLDFANTSSLSAGNTFTVTDEHCAG